MLRILLILFLTIPVIEIYLLIEVGSLIGALSTVVLVVFTAVLGAVLLRLQGFSTMQRVRGMLAQGEIPALEMMEGVVLLISGVMLLTPGFFTDAVGFLGLVPFLRRALIMLLIGKGLLTMGNMAGAGSAGPTAGAHRGVHGSSSPGTSSGTSSKRSSSPENNDSHTIEGEFWRHDDDHRK